jgi:hypothetical protein
MGIVGPFPDWMLERGKLANDYFTKEKLLYMEVKKFNFIKFSVIFNIIF